MDHQRLVARAADGVNDPGNGRDVIEMRMGQKYMIDFGQLRETQIRRTGASVDEDIIIHQKRSRSQIAANPSATPENFKPHDLFNRRLLRHAHEELHLDPGDFDNVVIDQQLCLRA